MAVDLVLGTPLAEALIELVSSEIFEIGWSSERQGSLLAKAIVDKLACAETPRQFAKDLAFNMRPYGEDVEEFGQWLFEQAIRLADVHKDSSVSGTNNEYVPGPSNREACRRLMYLQDRSLRHFSTLYIPDWVTQEGVHSAPQPSPTDLGTTSCLDEWQHAGSTNGCGTV